MNRCAKLLTISGLCGVFSVAQADSAVTVSSGQSLGGLFLSIDERQLLDTRRAAKPVKDSPVSQKNVHNADRPSTEHRQAVGYIVGPSGRRSTWTDGDFRPTNSTSVLRRLPLSGRIVIGIRKPPTAGEAHSSPDILAPDNKAGEASPAASAPSDDAVDR